MGSAYERATHHGVGVRETSKRSIATTRALRSNAECVQRQLQKGSVDMKLSRLLISSDGRFNYLLTVGTLCYCTLTSVYKIVHR